ncbi:hypothetical protein [uncultured Jatrophihabitans sp.]|uniref:hypothetical protein n=1 Tax=uncultured Jatrophihabitans sp. TaxID=1610747 RepID=UPI0035C9E900
MIAAAVLLAGCSSSGSGGSSGSSGGSGSAPTSSGSAANTSASSSTAPTTGDTTAVAIGGGGSFCGLARAEKANSAKAATAYTGSSPAQLKKLEETAMSQLPVFAAQAPSAIRPAVNTLVTAEQKLFKVLKSANFDFRKINPTALTSLESPAFTKATTTIDSYLTKVCHIPSSLPSS